LQHVDWNRGINTYCRIQTVVVSTVVGACLHKYVGHHYGEDMMESNLSIG